MNHKGTTMRQARLFLIASVTAIICAEVVAEIIQQWVVEYPSISTLSAYNGTLGNVPSAISLGATVWLVYGLLYQSNRRIVSIVVVGIGLISLSFLFVYMNIFSSTIEYYPGWYWTIPSLPLSNLGEVGLGIAIAAIVSFVFRDTMIRKPNPSA